MHGNSSSGPRRICKPAPQTTRPPPRRDDLPDAPDIDEEIDMASARAPSSAMYAMHSGPSAAVPQQQRQLQAFNTDEISKLIARTNQPIDLRHPTASAYAPPLPPRAVRSGTMGSDGVFVPEGSPADWDITSKIRSR
jgi:hypothetical protein